MQLSAPGPLWYYAVLVSYRLSGSSLIGSFQVYDSGSTTHNGIALDQETVQQYLDVELDPVNPTGSVLAALMNLLLLEYGGNAGLMAACVSQAVPFRFLH